MREETQVKYLSTTNLRCSSWTMFWLAVLVSPLPAQTALPAGQIIENVVCMADSTQSYALYLPSNYTPAKRWPIIYAFDPFARGRSPVRLYKDAAEKYGYIIAGSNNSRNFSLEASSKGANAMWQDTHTRLSLDEKQTYTTGLSGGARVAGLLALRCPQCKIAGVITHGAGYPNTDKPKEKDRYLYFLAVGNEDFNWPEIMNVRREREDLGLPYRVREFSGPHQWAPPDVVAEAVEWIHLKAMQAGTIPPDKAFVDGQFAKTQGEAADAEKRGDALAELAAYRSLVSDFGGLRDVTEYSEKLSALKKSPSLKEALKKEQEKISEQASLFAEVSPKIADFADATADQRLGLRDEVLTAMHQLTARAAHSKSEDKRLVTLRAFHDLWAQGIESGQAQFESRHYDKAEAFFELMSQVDPSDAWPSLLLAETRTAMGNRKQAIKDLQEAVRRGLKNPEILEKDANLAALRSEAEFQRILENLRSRQN